MLPCDDMPKTKSEMANGGSARSPFTRDDEEGQGQALPATGGAPVPQGPRVTPWSQSGAASSTTLNFTRQMSDRLQSPVTPAARARAGTAPSGGGSGHLSGSLPRRPVFQPPASQTAADATCVQVPPQGTSSEPQGATRPNMAASQRLTPAPKPEAEGPPPPAAVHGSPCTPT